MGPKFTVKGALCKKEEKKKKKPRRSLGGLGFFFLVCHSVIMYYVCRGGGGGGALQYYYATCYLCIFRLPPPRYLRCCARSRKVPMIFSKRFPPSPLVLSFYPGKFFFHTSPSPHFHFSPTTYLYREKGKGLYFFT